MNIDMTRVLRSLDGEELEQLEQYDNKKFISTEETPDEKPQHVRKKKITLRSVCLGSLMGTLETDRTMKGEEKLKQFALAMKIQGLDSIDLIAEEVTLLKKRIGQMCRPLVVGRAFELLDPVKVDDELSD